MNKSFLKSPNFWFGVVAVLAAIFGAGFPEQVGKEFVSIIIAALGSLNILYHYFRDLDKRPSFKDILKNPAFWGSLLAVVVNIFPILPGAEIKALVDAILTGNMTLIINAAIGLLIAAYKIWQNRPRKS